MINIHQDNFGRRLLINLKLNEENMAIVNAYARNNDNARKDFLKRLKIWTKQNATDENNIFILGDLNTVEHQIDRASKNLDGTSKLFTEVRKYCRVQDLWHEKHKTEIQYTFCDPGKPQVKSRIDYILCNSYWATLCNDCSIESAPAPDHYAVTALFTRKLTERGPGYWKLNTTVLNEIEYQANITKIINNTRSEFDNTLSKRMTWDLCKVRIKEFSITYCIQRKKQQQKDITFLENKIKSIDKLLSNQGVQNDLLCEKHALKKELDKYYEEKSRGYFIRSRAKWREEGEKSTSYFLGLEKKHQKYNVIESIKKENGLEVNNTNEMLNEAKTFYSTLYTSTNPKSENIEKYLESVKFSNILNEIEKNECEGLITLEECEHTVENTKK